ncbi:ATP-binding protein [Salinimonas sediminis]|uniref:endopeptidase La n=1 Tax=Salinimonas sediminis TaxID=2303538 RepID=A0A346NLL9_9ALTE|nr:ATP-binding protein [Salinimonas sediminis]AXR06426.1 ATP-binding protein [Salinimonas sediminis]
MTSAVTPSALDAEQLAPRLNRRLIAQALKDDACLNATFIGQERAREALTFGLAIKAKGYNLYVMGEPATGRFTLVRDYLEREAARLPSPDDWCYIANLEDDREPMLLRLGAAEARRFLRSMQTLIDDLLATFPAAFDNPGYQRKKSAIAREYDLLYDKAIDSVERYASANDVAMVEKNGNISFSPMRDGKAITDSEFATLDDTARQYYYDLVDDLENRLTESLISLPVWQRQNSDKLRQLNRDTAENGIRPLLKSLEHTYANNLGILKYLRQLRTHLTDTIVALLVEEAKEDKPDELDRRDYLEELYLPNVLVSHKIDAGAPIIYEPNPTYQNLFGRIEYTNVHGSVFTNYRMIRPGALHRANGGYLMLDVDQLIEQPYVWDTLKLAIKSGTLKMDLPQQDIGMVNAITLNPQPMDLNIKVILLGSRDLYYTLQDYDDEFDELFRVLVDFDPEIPMVRQALFDFIGKVRQHAHAIGLTEISSGAMARLVQYSLRMAEHREKLSAHIAEILELVSEAAYFCMKSQQTTLHNTHIETALQAKKRRTGRVSQTLLDDIKEGHVLIETQGTAVGQVNGLTVLEVGDTAFGTPARITSTVYAGANGVVDIEREVELGQPIHSKGVMLLTGYLGNKYAQHFPLTLSANIALEQSYGHIDGDSASLGELVALISALTGIPALQSLAITGSINQYGEVQAVGGVNEKIEGFFDLCQHRGLTGEQGVIIPHSNTVNLVLDSGVIDAVKRGQFHIYTVKTVDDAITLLMQQDAGVLNSKGRYPKNSINYHAVNRLYNIALIVNGGEE